MAHFKFDVEIEGETYCLNEVPGENSAVVKAETDKLLEAIDLKALVDDLGHVGSLIQIAYNGMGAAGPKHHIEIQRLGYDVTKLCDKSALTVAKFKKASKIILTDLQSTYEDLLDNLEEMALETLSSVSRLAGDMEKAALELHEDFTAEEKRVEEILEKTQRDRGAEEQRIMDLRKEREKMEIEKNEQQKLMERHQSAEQEATARRCNLEKEEDAALALAVLDPEQMLIKVSNGLTSKYIGVKFLNEEGPEKKVAALKESSRTALELEQALCIKKQDVIEQIIEFTCKIADCSTEKNMAEIAADALHQAIRLLKHLSVIMIQAANFWKQMQNHCCTLAEPEMKNEIERAVEKYSEEKRLKVWTSRGFKIKAIEFYAGWVALHSMCTTYLEYIKITQQDLYRFIEENPTYKESCENVKEQGRKFHKELQDDKKELADKEFATQKKIKALGTNARDLMIWSM